MPALGRGFLWYASNVAEQRIETGSISPLGHRLWWLIGGRAAAVVLLFLGAAAWRWNAVAPAPGNAITDVLPIIASIAALTVIYCIARIVWKNYAAQASIQFFFDIVLVTWLVWVTGHARSPYAALYIVIISVASLYVGPRGAMITSIFSAAAFNAAVLYAITTRGATSEVLPTQFNWLAYRTSRFSWLGYSPRS
jgi:hypothetical protein